MNVNVKITGTKHNIKCLDCGHTWGVYLDENEELPEGWNICLKCASRKIECEGECKDERVTERKRG
jgi:hypothetical protein